MHCRAGRCRAWTSVALGALAGLLACAERRDPAADALPPQSSLGRDRGMDSGYDAAPADSAADRAPAVADLGPVGDWSSEPLPPGWHASTIASVDLHAVACVAGEVFAVGDGGTILYYRPGLGGFRPQSAGTTADLYTVSFADKAYGVVAGHAPQIWETRDMGGRWDIAPQCSAFVFETFHALHMYAAAAGFGAGVARNDQGAGYKYYGGSSWVCPYTTYPKEVFYDVLRVANSGWIVGATGGKVYRTTDEGMSWSPVSASTTQALRGIHRAGSGALVAVGEGGAIVRSTDGAGVTWSAVSAPVTAALRDVHFQGDAGWAVGEGGTVLHSSDGGQSWQAQTSPTSVLLEGVCFTSAREGWAVGAAGTLLRTTSGGS